MASARLQLGGGLSDMLKSGTKHMENVVVKNIEACAELGALTRTSLGPNGMNKLIVNHLDKAFVTSDAATILSEMEIVHPAAMMVALAAKMQESEYGDGTNLVVAFASELLQKAKILIQMGLHPSEIVAGYKRASLLCAQTLVEISCGKIEDLSSAAELQRAVNSVTATKFHGYENMLSKLVVDACLLAVTRDESTQKPTLIVDNVRVVKMPGGAVEASSVVKGMVIRRPPMGLVKSAKHAGVGIFAANLESAQTEAKGTVMLDNAEDLLKYTGSEEDKLEEQIRGIKESGVDVIIAGGSVSEMALNFVEKHGLMCIKVTSKWELRRLCKTTGAFPVSKIGPLQAGEIGRCDSVETREIGGEKCIVFEQSAENSSVASVVLRSSTASQLDDLERAIDDGVNTVKSLCVDPRLVAGAGACEMELAVRVSALGESAKGLEQYPITKFAEALEIVPRTLAENAGLEPNEVISKLYAAHKAGQTYAGVDIDHEVSGKSILSDANAAGIVDTLVCKLSAIALASDVAITVLTIDQLIMAKQAGGPKLPQQNPGQLDA